MELDRLASRLMKKSVTDFDFVKLVNSKAVGSIPSASANGKLSLVVETALTCLSGLFIASMVLVLAINIISNAFTMKKKKNLPPSIPGGWPVLGNLLQLRDGKPYELLTQWAAKYGPIFHLQTGSIHNAVIASADLARQVLITKYASLSTRRLSTAFWILSEQQQLVTMADDGDQHRMLKKLVVGHLLGPNAQKANRLIRENEVAGMLDEMFAAVEGNPSPILDVREFLKQALFFFSLQEVFGYVPEGVHVPEMGQYVKRSELFESLVTKILVASQFQDWRNFFPALSFLPNKKLEKAISDVESKKSWIISALIEERRNFISRQGPTKCYADLLLTGAKNLNTVQLRNALWEPLVGNLDSSSTIIEWAMYEIARHADIQDRLYKEMKSVVAERMVSEDDLDKLPLLAGIVQETLRCHAPFSVLTSRYCHENITIGGYDIPKGWSVLVNMHGLNMDPTAWPEPKKWNPDRHLEGKDINCIGKDSRFLHFGGGKRYCPGMAQAMHVVRMNIAALVLHFEWTIPPTGPNDDAVNTMVLTNQKLHPLKAMAKPRVSSRILPVQ